MPPGPRSRGQPLATLLAAALAGSAAAEPFEPITVQVEGRPIDVLTSRGSGNSGSKGLDWLVISVAGTPPQEERHLSFFPGVGGGALASAPSHSLRLPLEVVGFDFADVDPAPGQELVLLRPGALELRRLGDGSLLRTLDLPSGASLPARTREVSRLTMVGAWNGDGRPTALVPESRGALLVDFAGLEPRPIRLPLVAEYQTTDSEPPAHDSILAASIEWPALGLGDDDGDGRPDLFALSRYAIWIFHNGESGLPSSPTRTLSLRPFTPEEEFRYEATAFRHLVRDIDGNGAADLVLDAGAGTLLRSRHATEVFLNTGSGVTVDREPDLRLALADAVAEVWLEDLDGDGRLELVRGALTFGIFQAIRMLLTRGIRFDYEVYALSPAGGLARTWRGQLGVGLDFSSGRVRDLLPSVEGDWNGDGRRDLLYGAGGGRLGIRLGMPTQAGPGFGPRVARQSLPATARSAVADLDGDGLDDLVVYDPKDAEGRVYVLRNRGVLEGTPPGLTAPATP